jgi:predicted nucleotidyltransferase
MNRHPNIPVSAWQFLVRIAGDQAIQSLILFGSRAIGDHEEHSDVDVAVCGPSINRLDWARLRDAAYKANSLYWISLVHFDRNPSSLQMRILKTGVVIYVRTQST